jgi:hypothetical protein
MDRGDYYQAKAAMLNLKCVQLENELRARTAQAGVAKALEQAGVPAAGGYTWDDETLTISPQGGGPSDGR